MLLAESGLGVGVVGVLRRPADPALEQATWTGAAAIAACAAVLFACLVLSVPAVPLVCAVATAGAELSTEVVVGTVQVAGRGPLPDS